ENELSEERTSPRWEEPRGQVYKATVIRAVSMYDGCPASEVVTNSYFVHPDIYGRYTFPIISLTTDDDHFFDEVEGIYVPGVSPEGNYVNSGAEWERPVFMEVFGRDGQKVYQQALGARIH